MCDDTNEQDSQMITELHVRNWIARYRLEMNERADELNKLDAALGDGDYGASMQRGLDAVDQDLQALADRSIGAVLITTGSTFVSAIGGTSGPLVGSLFLKTGQSIGSLKACDLATFATGLRDGANAVMTLGGATVGDKTMIDALVPAVEALEAAANQELDLPSAVKSAAEAAARGAENTRTLAARRGRASYVGDGGLGLLDAGAQGIAILFGALSAALDE